MKRIITFMMAMLMVAVLCVPAFAASDGSIILDNPQIGETYHLYKIFDMTNSGSAYAYYLPKESPWESFFIPENEGETAPGAAYFKIDPVSRLVTPLKSTQEMESVKYDMANAMMAYIGTNKPTAVETQTIAGTDLTEGKYTFSNLEYGYYLLDTTTGTVCAINSAGKNVHVQDKTPVPTVKKKVNEDDGVEGTEWADTASAAILQTVHFKVTVENIARLNKLVLHDTMSDGLTFNSESLKISKIESSIVETDEDSNLLTKDTDYVLITDGTVTDSCTFHVEFTETFLSSVGKGMSLIVTYDAQLNTNAVVGDEGNPNETKLTYGDKQETEKSEVTVKTWPLKVFKYTNGTDGGKTALANAEFVVLKKLSAPREDGSDYALVTSVDDTTGKITGWKYIKKDNTDLETSGAKIFVSDADGNINVSGLDSDNYDLVEVKAPDGYNLLSSPIRFKIGADGKVSYDDVTNANIIEVLNSTGAVLPSTGGIGTTMFILIGSLLVLFSGVLLATKLRMSKMRG